MKMMRPRDWRVLMGRIRHLRRLLGWKEASRLALAEQAGHQRVKVILPGLGTHIELRLGTTDPKVFEKIWLEQEYLPPFQIAPKFIIDAGANIGLSALYFAHLFPQAEIVALEPEAVNFRLLTENCVKWPLIRPQQVALWNRSASLHIADQDAASWCFRVAEDDGADVGPETSKIRATTIPQLLAQYGRERVDFLKLDIEGAERELFTPACQEWLPKVGTIAIELHDRARPGCSRAFYSELVKHPFLQEQRGENIFVMLTPTT